MSGTVGPRPESIIFNNQFSFDFDGTNDFISMGNVLNMANDGTDPYSISCWFKTTDTGLQMLVSKQLNVSPFNGYNLYLDTNRIKFSFGQIFNDYIQGQTALIGTITDGNWHHVVITYDGSQDISGFNLYYDNSNVTILTIANNIPNNVSNSADFMIGVRGVGTGSFGFPFQGNIDEVTYFNTELSASDVTSIYNGGTPNNIISLSPIGWWRMGDKATFSNPGGLGDWTLVDQGSGGNNGTSDNMGESNRVEDTP